MGFCRITQSCRWRLVFGCRSNWEEELLVTTSTDNTIPLDFSPEASFRGNWLPQNPVLAAQSLRKATPEDKREATSNKPRLWSLTIAPFDAPNSRPGKSIASSLFL